MKNIKIISSLILLISASSCSDFLSEIPDNRTQVDTPERISELLVSAYPHATYFTFAETMSDNTYDCGSTSTEINNEKSFNWEVQNQIGLDTEVSFWTESYVAIAAANQALDAIEKQGNPASLNPQKGEALLTRAYNHFMLVQLWSNRYNPATADTDLGVPYIKKPETTLLVQYKRNTVEEVFDFIEQDIMEGMKYITDNYKEPKFHFNINAAKAFACRFYLIKGEWNKVLEYSKGLGSRPQKIRDYLELNRVDPSQESVVYTAEEQDTNLLIDYPNSIADRALGYRFAFPSAARDNILGPSTNIWGKDNLINALGSFGAALDNVFVSKLNEYFKATNLTSGVGNPYVGTILFSNDEMYLNRIEALVMKNRLTEANLELEYFLGEKRTSGYNPQSDKLTEAKVVRKYPVIANEFSPFYTLTPIQTSYIKAIAEARRREFIHEGLRWFDIKRFNLVVVHNTLQNGKVIRNNILEKDDKRRVLQIPSRALDTGIEKNPR